MHARSQLLKSAGSISVSKFFSILVFLIIFLISEFFSPFLALADEVDNEERVYVVKKGDILGKISDQLFGTCKKANILAQYNGITNPNFLAIGQKIRYKMTFKQGLTKEINVEPKTEAKPETDSETQTEIKTEKTGNVLPTKPVTEDPLDVFQKGKNSFDGGDFKSALIHFTKSRQLKPEHVPSWFYEISTHLKLNQESKAKALGSELLKIHPEFAGLPLFKERLKITQTP